MESTYAISATKKKPFESVNMKETCLNIWNLHGIRFKALLWTGLNENVKQIH